MLTLVVALLGPSLLAVPASNLPVEGNWAAYGTTISMTREGCTRRCPVRHVVIVSVGIVVVEGRDRAGHAVLATAEIPSSAVKKLVEHFEAIDYFKLPDQFGYMGSSCTSFGGAGGGAVTTTIAQAGHGKSITHHRGCMGIISDQLTELEREIDRTARSPMPGRR